MPAFCAMLYVVMQALELMKTHVVKTTPDASLAEAVDLMDLYQVHGLPVADENDALCGIVTERDVLRAFTSGRRSACVREYMTSPVISISEHAQAEEAARVLLNTGVKRLPVTDERGRVIGMLNRIDVFQAILENSLDMPDLLCSP